VISVAFGLTDSRFGLLTLVVGLVLLGWSYRTRIKLHIVRGAALTVMVVAGVIAVNMAHAQITHSTAQTGGRLAEIAQGRSTSGSDRIYFLKSSFAIWETAPVLGKGLGTFATLHPQYQIRTISASTHVHNTYAEVLAELGVVGLILMLGSVTGVLWLCIRQYIHRTNIVLSVICALMLGHLALDIEAYYPVVLASLGLLIGILYGVRKEEAKISPVLWGKPWIVAVLCVAMALPLYSQAVAYQKHLSAGYNADEGDIQAAANLELEAADLPLVDPDYISQSGAYIYSLSGGVRGVERTNYLKVALASAQKAQKLDTYDGRHFQLEGKIRQALGESKEAEVAYRRSLVLDPYNSPSYALDLGNLLFGQQRLKESRGVVEEMLDKYPDEVIVNRSIVTALPSQLASLYALQAKIDLAEEKRDDAISATKKGLKLDPKNLSCRAMAHQLGI
jgi:tetratricopeptide (TPR) repeat protein